MLISHYLFRHFPHIFSLIPSFDSHFRLPFDFAIAVIFIEISPIFFTRRAITFASIDYCYFRYFISYFIFDASVTPFD